MHAFAVDDPEAFAGFADAAVVVVRATLLHSKSEAGFRTAVMALCVFPLERQEFVENIVTLDIPILPFRFVLDVCTMIATAHAGVPKTFWPRIFARVHKFAGETRKEHHQNAANSCRAVVDVIEELSRLGP
jgi:hypothetical protein